MADMTRLYSFLVWLRLLLTRLYSFLVWLRLLRRLRHGQNVARQAWRLSQSR